MNVIDLFSGVGGFSCGLEKIGFNVVLANEIDNQIAISYKKNHQKTLMINSDISDFSSDFERLIDIETKKQKFNKKEVLKKLNNINIIVGGPPCQGFSMAGGRIRNENKFIEDPRNYLFKEYFKIVQKIEPEYFVMENVAGLISMKKGAILKEIEKLFTSDENFKNGAYYLQKKVFETDKIGIPQKRKRFVIIGAKQPFDIENVIDRINKETKYSKFKQNITIKDAISDLAFNHKTKQEVCDYLLEPQTEYQKKMRVNNKTLLYNHKVFNHSEHVIDRISRIKQGENWSNLKEHKEIKSVHSGAYGRMEWDKQSVTITTRFDTPSAGRFIHPDFNRNITAREAARLQSFPDDFIFYGTKTSICKQIGNAVPPMLGEYLGLIIKTIEDDNSRKNK